jgi:hypothetical protein
MIAGIAITVSIIKGSSKSFPPPDEDRSKDVAGILETIVGKGFCEKRKKVHSYSISHKSNIPQTSRRRYRHRQPASNVNDIGHPVGC